MKNVLNLSLNKNYYLLPPPTLYDFITSHLLTFLNTKTPQKNRNKNQTTKKPTHH